MVKKIKTCKRRGFQHMAFLFTLQIFVSPLITAPFTDNGDGTVTDQKTNLVWQKCSMGQTNDAICSGTATSATWANMLTYCNNLTLAGKSVGAWRLPNVNELNSIVDETKSSPAIDTTSFPATIAAMYLSSSTKASFGTTVWHIYFLNGSSSGTDKSSSVNVFARCVSGP